MKTKSKLGGATVMHENINLKYNPQYLSNGLPSKLPSYASRKINHLYLAVKEKMQYPNGFWSKMTFAEAMQEYVTSQI